MDEILSIVSRSLSATAETAPGQSVPSSNGPTYTETVNAYEVEQGWDHDAENAVFDDMGEGVGVEGDLDMEDDE